EHQPDINVSAAERVRVFDVRPQDVHRVIRETDENGNERAPAEIPKSTAQQIGVHLLLGFCVNSLLERNVHEIEEIEQSDPGDAGNEVAPSQQDSREGLAARRIENSVKESQTDGKMSS